MTGFAGCAQYAVQSQWGGFVNPPFTVNCPRNGHQLPKRAFVQQRSALAVKKLILSCVALALTFGCVLSVNTASAQDAAVAPSKVGLIDMAHVFKNYEKFKVLRDDLKTEIQGSDQKAKSMAGQIKTVQDQLKTFTEGSPEYLAKEKELASLASDFEAFRKVAQRDFLRKEAEIYKTVYLEVSDAVKLYAQHYKYAVILRFNREDINDAKNPEGVLQSMNRQVVYHYSKFDITDAVLQYLNQRYDRTAGRAQPARN
ncbi:MAG: OmpH family outer membrane protein [Planctomycetaceae bacterium]|nr:OmpH family outer membrane protein [Planctomycetaceae bacterium]